MLVGATIFVLGLIHLFIAWGIERYRWTQGDAATGISAKGAAFLVAYLGIVEAFIGGLYLAGFFIVVKAFA